MARTCYCVCHRSPDDAPPLYGVRLLDDVGRLTACSACANEHWRAFYLATEPEPRTPREVTEWADPPSQADGWKSE